MSTSYKTMTVFCWYDQKDEKSFEQLETHFAPQLPENILWWHKQNIPPGVDREKTIDEHLEKASIILLLISPDFFHSLQCDRISETRIGEI